MVLTDGFALLENGAKPRNQFMIYGKSDMMLFSQETDIIAFMGMERTIVKCLSAADVK